MIVCYDVNRRGTHTLRAPRCGQRPVWGSEQNVKTRLQCPCGVLVKATDEDELVELTQRHLEQAHPGLTYERDEILFIAY
jgi:predicted small metal-binding protein